MKDLILNDMDELNLEYKCGGGFRNFFRMTSSDFEILLNLAGPLMYKSDTTFDRSLTFSFDHSIFSTMRLLQWLEIK